MNRGASRVVLAGVLIGSLAGPCVAVTREIADFQPVRLRFPSSVLNQLSYDTYREPFDELQSRPYNLLFSNIGRHPNLSPWQGQAGSYTRYLNALIGNNGAANVDNDADAMQGAMIRRETAALAWGVSAAYLSGSTGSDGMDSSSTFLENDELTGFDVRGATALQISERHVLGMGVRLTRADDETASGGFEPGVGGFRSEDSFRQSGVRLDAGLRRFQSANSSWEAQIVAGLDSVEQDNFGEDLDAGGAVTDRYIETNYDISNMTLGLSAAYSRLRLEGLGETEFRLSYAMSQRELDNADLAFTESGGTLTPDITLLEQDTIGQTLLSLSAKTIFQAGETEMFGGAVLEFGSGDGGTQFDQGGTIAIEEIDDSQMHLGLTVGLRQPLFSDKIRFIISGRADLLDEQLATNYGTSSISDDQSRSTAQYAIGLEGVLANVTFDVAWLNGEEAPVVPVELGLPQGSRRSVELDRMVFSAAVSW